MAKGNIQVETQNIFPVIKKCLYSDKDIFIRELVVNACDAITKHKKLVSIGEAEPFDGEYRIDITCDKEAKTITVKDNGIGMSEEEVDKYINQLAFSGAAEFLEKYQGKDDSEKIIGHFGLGFYSAFMVADSVDIITKSYTDDPAVEWNCDGGVEYEMKPSEKTERGSEMVLHISRDGDEFLEPMKLTSILLKYCGFLPYPIYIDGHETPVNDTAPLWYKSPKDCKDEEYIELYHRVFSDVNDPLFWIHLNTDFPFEMRGILYFPKLTHEFESAEGQIKLYNSQVFVADNIKEVIPEFLMLLKGVLDCPEIPLNVSRSALQNDGCVTKISAHITKKVADKLISLHKTESENYEKYYDDIAPFIEYGCLRDEKFYEKLKPVLMAHTTDGDFVSLLDYAEKNGKNITYVSNKEQQAQYIKMLKEDGKTALILPHIIDTHFISLLEMKEEYKFTRIDAVPDVTSDNEGLVNLFKTAIGIEELKVATASLKTTLPAIIAEDEQSRRMSDITRMFGQGITPVTKTLVLNAENKIIKAVEALEDKEKQAVICKEIFDIAKICHTPLTAEEMSDFAERTAKILEMLL